MKSKKKVDVLLPCYNEEKTLGECINRIHSVMKKQKQYSYNIVVCDNNSKDNSREIAKSKKAKVLVETKKGYGATLLNGINNSSADYLVMLDSDLSYNEKDIPRFLEELENGYDLVMGNRFKGTIEKGAMPFSHRYGSRLLTEYANLLFHTPSHDYHSGLRAFKREEILKCDLSSSGFEFATEMIIKSKINHLKIKEISTDLFCDGRDKPPHLKTIKDGLRHFFLINKVKFQSSLFVRYSSTFLFMIIFMFFALMLTAMIPRKWIYKNTVKSMDFFDKYYHKQLSNINYAFLLEGCGDVRNLSLAYSMNPKKPFDSAIRMSYQSSLDPLLDLKKTFKESNGEVENYSRYWHGQAMYSKIMLVFMPLKYTYYVQFIVLAFFFILLTKELFSISKRLAIAFILMNIGINSFFTSFSVQFFFAILLSFVFSIIVIRLYKKNSRYMGLMFAINGITTCFFDFLTCETLVLTLPLFFYIYLVIKDEKKLSIKEIINYILIWGFFYSLTFFTKWFIACAYFGFDYYHIILEKAMLRAGDQGMPIYIKFFKVVLLCFGNMIPYNFIKDGIIYHIIVLLIGFYFFVFDYKKYYPLIVPALIPFGRIILISTHSHLFYYFTYRAFGVVLILICYIYVEKIGDLCKRIYSSKKKSLQ